MILPAEAACVEVLKSMALAVAVPTALHRIEAVALRQVQGEKAAPIRAAEIQVLHQAGRVAVPPQGKRIPHQILIKIQVRHQQKDKALQVPQMAAKQAACPDMMIPSELKKL